MNRHLRPCAAGALLALVSCQDIAAERITPTDDPGSDCVAAVILAERSANNRPYDEMYCSVNKTRAAYDNCMHNSASAESVRFFTDRCNAESEGAFVSINGRSHRVWRTHRQPHQQVSYAGTYAGGDVTVRIKPRRLVERLYEGSEPVGVRYAVDVFITKGGETVMIEGIYDNRP